MRDILSGNEQEGEPQKGGRRAARAGKLISLYRECSQHEPYATWLTSFHELKVSASRCGLRYRADYYTTRYALEWEGKREQPREEGEPKGVGEKSRQERARKSGEEILMYTTGVLTSLKSGRLIAQSHIIPRFRVTKPRRGGLYQLEARASAREKGAMLYYRGRDAR